MRITNEVKTIEPSALEIELAKWPDAPGVDEPIELAMAIAGEVWQVILERREKATRYTPAPPTPPIDFERRIIRVSLTRARWMFPKLIATARRVTCISRLSGESAAMAEVCRLALPGE